MVNARRGLSAVLIAGLLAGGCQSDSRATIVVEYRPKAPPITKKAPDSQVYILWRWYPVVAATTAPTFHPAQRPRRYPFEVVQVYAQKGTQIGFRRQGNQLIGVAAATTRPLDDASYTWRTLPGSNTRIENRNNRVIDVFSFVGEAIVVTVMFPVVLFSDQQPDDDEDAFPDQQVHYSKFGRGHALASSPQVRPSRPSSRPAQ